MILLVVGLLGLCAGSFVNALVWRVYAQQNKSQRPKKATAKDLSIATGRSMCPDCGHTLAWYDLIPVISWVTLKGKCRYCHKAISWQYPLVELATAGLFIWSYLVWVQPWNGYQNASLLLWLITLTGLIALFIYDFKWMLLPNKIVFPLYIPAVGFAVVKILGDPKPIRAAIATAIAAIFLGGLFWALFQLSKGQWIGGGDVKLGFLLGLLAGTLLQSMLLLFIASALGTLVALPLMIAHKAKATTRLAFGPFLIAGAVFVVLYGSQVIAWYNRLFGI